MNDPTPMTSLFPPPNPYMSAEASVECDCLIVGASFAGLSCATALSLNGKRASILERKSDPGERLHTTGIIVKEAAQESPLLAGIPSALVRKLTGVRLYSPNLQHIDLESPGYYFLATDTPEVMRWLTQRAREAGVTVLLGREFRSATKASNRWTIQGVGVSQYLVGADGPGSRVAREASLGASVNYLSGIEYEYPSFDFPAPHLLHCFIDQKLAPGYIGWVVNGVRTVQVGLARRTRGREMTSPRDSLRGFIEKIFPAIDLKDRVPIKVRAGKIPCGGLVNPLAAERVLLIGDAAGMVSPVTAGGIHTALKHGWAAGEAIAAFLSGNVEDPAGWFVQSYPHFRAKRMLRYLFDHFQSDALCNLLLGTPLMRAAAEMIYFHHQGVFGGRR